MKAMKRSISSLTPGNGRDILLTITVIVAAIACCMPEAIHAKSRKADSFSVSANLRSDFAALASTYSADWTDVKLPVTIRTSAPMNFKISGVATIIRNRSIHLSLRMLGFEVGVLQIDGDSVFAAIKPQKRYVAESVSEMLHGFPATVGNLQSLLLGQLFVPGTSSLQGDSFILENADDPDLPQAFLLTPQVDLRGVAATFVANGGTVPYLMALTASGGQSYALCLYSTPTSTPAGAVSDTCEISAEIGSHSLQATLTFDFNKAQWNTGIVPRRITTKGYTRIPASSLLHSFSSF